MAKQLVIVESPAKAKTIAKFLGPDYVVESSIGHIRDLPKGASDVPASLKSLPWSRLGVDVDNSFKPLYVISKDKKAQVTKLKALLKDADELYLATDEDREGESIAWHLMEVLAPKVPVKRMVFHEITKAAIATAINQTRNIDRQMVDAQEARRIIDRLYGYEVSPVLWRKVLPKLSAGRVQSVATRIIVERERARMAFKSANWWDLSGKFSKTSQEFSAGLVSIGGSRVAGGKDFSDAGEFSRSDSSKVVLLNQETADRLKDVLESQEFQVASVEHKPYRRSPAAPFMTSTLQQEAGRKLRFSAKRTMSIAQSLYENGYITYMRTDSTALADSALASARTLAAKMYGERYVSPKPRTYANKVKNAQEAHEAIRPAGEEWPTPENLSAQLSSDEVKLYELIWKRTVASQMSDAEGSSAQVRLKTAIPATFPADFSPSLTPGQEVLFGASGKVITFPGFLRAYVEGADDPEAELDSTEVRLPPLNTGDIVELLDLAAESHNTSPPARYTEASLVKALEDMGVGRPSTYASIIGTILDRGYVWKKGTALVPSFVAFAVVTLLERYFYYLVDYNFTAALEDSLDQIAKGEKETIPYLSEFYFGTNGSGLKSMVQDHLDEIDPREINSIPIGNDPDGNEILARVGKFGPYLSCNEATAPIPADLAPDELTVEKALELLSQSSSDLSLGTDPESGLSVWAKVGRFGPFVQLGDPSEMPPKEKPKTASLLSSQSLSTVTLEEAIKLLSLPRDIGIDPSDGQVIQAANGRYGPYLKKGSVTRSLPLEDEIFTIDLNGALALLAAPKIGRGGQARKAGPVVVVGETPDGKEITLRTGRFGPYVTDGEVNASLRVGDTLDELTIERAVELIEMRKESIAVNGGVTKKRSTRGTAAKKTAAKRSTRKTKS
ncbi:MAG: type I DNA topoisomerase [Acidimicrobiaceae bacterium]|nr:type I DNA topoisomerase [Acidimicrobiaceae bacterium]